MNCSICALCSAWHGTTVGWVPQCSAWWDGVGALVKPTAAAIRRLCLRPVTWWEPAGSAAGPSRGCQAPARPTLWPTDHSGSPIWTPDPHLLPPGGKSRLLHVTLRACKHLIISSIDHFHQSLHSHLENGTGAKDRRWSSDGGICKCFSCNCYRHSFRI